MEDLKLENKQVVATFEPATKKTVKKNVTVAKAESISKNRIKRK